MLKGNAAGAMRDPQEQTAAGLLCSSSGLLTFTKKPVPTRNSDDTTNDSVWRKMTAFLAYTLHFNSWGCLFHLLHGNISYFETGDRRGGGDQHKGQCLTSALPLVKSVKEMMWPPLCH